MAFESVEFSAECLAAPDGWSDEEKYTTHYTQASHALPGLVCTCCGATSTPQWREGPEGPKTLCNACGVKWYRAAKKTRKPLSKPTAVKKPPLPSHSTRSHPKRSRRPPASHFDMSEEEDFETSPSNMVSGDSEDSEEHVAALSLLSFAGAKAQLLTSTWLGGATALLPLPFPAPAQLQHPVVAAASGATALLPLPFPAPAQLQHPVVAAASTSVSLDPAAAFNMVSNLLPSKEQSHLRRLHAAVEEAYRELQAADAAAMAVASFLSEKQQQALVARQRAEDAGRRLLEEIKQMGAHSERVLPNPAPMTIDESDPTLREDYQPMVSDEP